MKQAEGPAPQLQAGLFHPQRLRWVPTHPPISLGSLEEKAFSTGVVFEKESNHLSLCIIACSRNISSLGSKCSLCADPGSSLRWGLLGLQPSGSQRPGADRGCRHTCLFPPCTVTFWQSSHLPLSYRRPRCLSSPWLSKAIPSIEEGQGARSVFQSVAQRST